MNEHDFTVWLRGVLEFNKEGLTAGQVVQVLEKLDTINKPKVSNIRSVDYFSR